MKPETQEELATMIFEVQNWSDATLVAVQLWPHLNGPAQPTRHGAIDFQEIERIGGIAGGRNPDIAHALRILETNGLIDSAAQPPAAPVETKPDWCPTVDGVCHHPACTCVEPELSRSSAETSGQED